MSEDEDGVYYQASNGFRRLLKFGGKRPGGLYVSKTKAQTIFAYEGDARKPGNPLHVDTQRLSGAQLRKLKIGRAVK